jgi:hypothetical protein
MALIAALVLLTGGKGSVSPGDRGEQAATLVPPADPAVQAREARAAALAFLSARDWRNAMLWVRDPVIVEPMMRDYYDFQREPLPVIGTRPDEGQPSVVGGRLQCAFLLREPGGKAVPMTLEWTSQGFRVDWLSLSAYGTMAWARFLETRPGAPQDLRVYLSPAPVGNPTTPGEAPPDWTRFILEHRDAPAQVLEAWAPDGATAGRVADLLQGRSRVAVLLAARFEDWKDRRIAVLERVHHEGWAR